MNFQIFFYRAYKRFREKKLSPAAWKLYCFLLTLWLDSNKSEWVSVANFTACDGAMLVQTTLERARRELIKAGFIQYTTGSGLKRPAYKVLEIEK